jgi:predicted small lipoprotein YifL
LSCLILVACGKTGALFLPEKPQTQPETPQQDTELQNEQSQSQDTATGGKAD